MNAPVATNLVARQHIHLLRITLQLESPLAIGSGNSAGEFDSPCALDANGLPYLPGTSLAGALRAWYTDVLDSDPSQSATNWFGFAGNDEYLQDGSISPLRITSGHIHNSRDEVQDGQVLAADWAEEPVLGALAGALPYREHVRLNDRGVGADTGKFDRSFVPRGHRFTFQLQITPYPDEVAAWPALQDRLLAALSSGQLCLGSAQRAGFGRVRSIQAWGARIDLCNPAQRASLATWRRLSIKPARGSELKLVSTASTPKSGAEKVRHLSLALSLRACDYWRVSSANNGLRAPAAKGDAPDATPYREPFVNWTPVPAKLDHGWAIPASSIKGALTHRTTFHLNRLENRWAGQVDENGPWLAVQALFGSAAGDTPQHGVRSAAGSVWVDDALPTGAPPQVVRFNHVRLDRYTGGAYGGALFDEEALFGGEITVRINLQPSALSRTCPNPEARARVVQALQLALSDLANACLPLGADSANGLGFFEAKDPKSTQSMLERFVSDALVQTAAATTKQVST